MHVHGRPGPACSARVRNITDVHADCTVICIHDCTALSAEQEAGGNSLHIISACKRVASSSCSTQPRCDARPLPEMLYVVSEAGKLFLFICFSLLQKLQFSPLFSFGPFSFCLLHRSIFLIVLHSVHHHVESNNGPQQVTSNRGG